jgi:hypothetical protein
MYRITSGRPRPDGSPYSYYRCSGRGPGRASCGLLVPMEPVDEAVNLIMARRFSVEIMEHQIIYGNEAQIANELEKIRFRMRRLAAEDLPDDELDARMAELRAERDRVRDTELIEDDVQLVGTGRTYLEVWEETPVPKRGRWLAEEGFQVFASKTEVRVVKGARSGVLPLEGLRSRRRQSGA